MFDVFPHACLSDSTSTKDLHSITSSLLSTRRSVALQECNLAVTDDVSKLSSAGCIGINTLPVYLLAACKTEMEGPLDTLRGGEDKG